MLIYDPLSQREMDQPGTIRKVTGYMAICDECGSRYRRMGEGKFICGRCWPVRPAPLVDESKPAYVGRAFPPGKG